MNSIIRTLLPLFLASGMGGYSLNAMDIQHAHSSTEEESHSSELNYARLENDFNLEYKFNTLVVSPTGKSFLTKSYDASIRLWNIETGEPLTTLTGNNGIIDSVAYSPNEKLILTGSRDGTICVWDVQTEKVSKVIKRGTAANHIDTEAINTVAFSPDGKIFFTGSENGKLCTWDSETGSLLNKSEMKMIGVSSAVFSLDGEQILMGSFSGKVFQKTSKLHPLRQIEQNTINGWKVNDGITTVAFSPNRKTFLAGSDNGKVCLWGFKGPKSTLLRTFEGHSKGWYTKQILAVAFSQTGKIIFTGSRDGIVRLWSSKTGELLKTLHVNNNNEIKSLAFSPDCKTIMVGTKGNGLIVWKRVGKEHVEAKK